MRKGLKKAISVLLVAVMLFGIAPLSGFVGLELPSFAEIFNKKAEAATSGTCGDNLTWTFNESTGKLIISGTGDMYDFESYSDVPWYYYRKSIKSVSIGNRVTSIGGYAFYYGESLTSVTIPDSVTSIGIYAFENCTSLKSVIIGNGVESIGYSAFYNCPSLESITIPDGVTSIGSYAFGGCISLTSITIPDSVTSIGGKAFYKCTSLTSITVDKNNPNYSSDEYGVFFNKSKTELIQYPAGNIRTNYVIPNSVTSIGYNAFYNCTSLTSVNIPDSVTIIDSCAFECCMSLTSVTIPDSVTIIGNDAFYNCTNLVSVTIPDSVTIIGNTAFDNCTSLKSVIIGNGVESIGYGAFYNCPSLESITIPDGVTSIGGNAFHKCTSLTSITVDKNNPNYSSDEYGVFFNKSKTALIQYPAGNIRTNYVIPDSVTSIGYNAFYNCTSLESVTIPDSVTSISSSAFYNCTGLESVTIPDSATSIGYDAFYNCTSLESVTIPDSVTSICRDAFYNCTSLESVTIPDSVTSIDGHAFRNCTSLTSITVDKNNPNYSSDEYGVFFNKSKTELIQYPAGNTRKHYNIPDTVEHIGEFINYDVGFHCYVFMSSVYLESLTIPDSLKTVTGCAFKNCVSLKDIYYTGTETEWKNIHCNKADNETFLNATIHYNHVHGYTSAVTQKPTCTEKGIRVYTCVCGSYAVEIPELGHDIVIDKAVDATCTETGLTEGQHCSRCDDMTIKQNVIPALNHKDTLVKVDAKAPTCTEIGWDAYEYCTACTYTTYVEKDALKHDIVIDKAVAPTCTETGLTAGQHCSRCDDMTVAQEVIPALNHKDTLVKVDAKAPTCTEIGWDAYEYCTACTYTTYVEKDALKHDIVIDKAVEATCTSTGLTEGQHCSRCDDMTIKQEVIPALNHKDTLVKVGAKAPTCTKIGWDAYEYCTVCTYTTYVEKDALEHDIVIDKAVEATCTSTGLTAGQHCSRCDDMTVAQEVIPALNHKDTLVKVDAKAPTCTEIGWDAYEYCTACTYTTYVEKDALKHDIVIDKAVEATCISTGLTAGQHCSRCDDMTVEQEVVPVKLHNPTEKYDSSKHWKECVCGLKTNEENHSFNGGNVCSCGYRRTVNATLSIKNNMGSKTINYGETLKLTVNVTNKPTNARIYWYVDGVKRAEGEVFDISFENGSKIVTVKLVDANGVAYEGSNGNEISDSQTVTVNGGFFQKIISFFKNLFGMNRTVVQVLTGRL